MKKTLMIMLALVLVIAMSVTGTLAYLTSVKAVTNTFTYGKVEIALDEAKVNAEGKAINAETNRGNGNEYKLMPGHSYDKDPIVWFKDGSEASYLFVKVENGIKNIVADTTIESQIEANNWTEYKEIKNGEEVVAVVYYKTVAANTTGKDAKYPVFGSFKVKTDADVSGYGNATIKVTAYAVQQDGLSLDQAWAAVEKLQPTA